MRSTRKEELLQIPCNHGVDQTGDEHGSQVGTFRACTNMRIRSGGLLEKRFGTKAISGAVPSAAKRLLGSSNFVTDKPSFVTTVGDAKLLGTTSGRGFALDGGASNLFEWQGMFSTAKPVRERAGGNYVDAASIGAACISSNGYVVNAAQTGSVVWARMESPDGIRVATSLIAGSKSRIVLGDNGAGTEAFLIVTQNLTNISISIATPSILVIAPSAVRATLNAAEQYWDVTPYDATNWYMVHQSGATTVTVTRFSGNTAGTTATFTVSGNVPLSIFGFPEAGKVWVGYYDDPSGTGDVHVRVYDADLTNPVDTTLFSGADVYGPPLLGKFRNYETGGATETDKVRFVVRNERGSAPATVSMRSGTVTEGGTVAGPVDIWNCLPVSKPDNFNRVWAILTSGSSNQIAQKLVLLRLQDDAGVTTLGPTVIELASPNFQNYDSADGPLASYDFFGAISESTVLSAAAAVKRCVFACPMVITQSASASVSKLAVYEYTTGEQDQHVDSTLLGNSTVLAGQPTEFFGAASFISIDNVGAAEIGFAPTPVIIGLTGASGGSMTPGGTYSYRVVYEWADMYGRRHLSAPSPPVEITLTAAQSAVTVEFTVPAVTQRTGNLAVADAIVRELVYRTVAGGSTYHLAWRTSAVSTDGTNSVSNDTLSDDAIADEEPIYTDGGVQQNDLAPSCGFTCKSEDRVWAGGLWNPRIIQCSKVMVPLEPPTFTEHASHQVFLPDDCTGLAYQDGQVVAFCQRSIYLLAGDGPNDQGFGSFPSPRGYSQDVGCIDYKSIVETRTGVIFQGARGFYLIPRGFGPLVFIGAAIRDELETNGLTKVYASAVHGGTVSSDRYGGHLARWLVGTQSSTYATTVFTYDIDNGQWFKDTLDATNGRMLEMGAWPDGFAFVSSDLNADTNSAPIWYETGSFVGDASDAYYIPTQLRTAYYQPFGPGGWGHVKSVMAGVVPNPTGACQLTLSVQLDNNTPQPATWAIPTGTAPVYRGLPLDSPQHCTEMLVTLEDSELNGVKSRGVKLISLTIEAHDSGGARQLELTERA